jgi:predicted enzyme related to lactoylglutathione lyase
LHIDLLTADPAEAIGRLTSLGATAVGTPMSGSEGGWWQVMADPEGNEFCVCRVE